MIQRLENTVPLINIPKAERPLTVNTALFERSRSVQEVAGMTQRFAGRRVKVTTNPKEQAGIPRYTRRGPNIIETGFDANPKAPVSYIIERFDPQVNITNVTNDGFTLIVNGTNGKSRQFSCHAGMNPPIRLEIIKDTTPTTKPSLGAASMSPLASPQQLAVPVSAVSEPVRQ